MEEHRIEPGGTEQVGNRIALVDIDGTLFAGQTYMRILGWLWQRRWRRPRIAWVLGSSLVNHLLYQSGLADRVALQERWAKKIGWLFKGVEIPKLQALLHESWQDLSAGLRDSMLEQVARRHSEGFLVILASAAAQPIVTGLAGLVDADAGVGTPFATRNGRYTGGLAGPLCSGGQKIDYALDLELLSDTRVDLSESYAYGDSCFDLPMLEQVGHPVVVAPDPELAAVAGERGWSTIAE